MGHQVPHSIVTYTMFALCHDYLTEAPIYDYFLQR